MLTRRRFVGYSALSTALLAYPRLMRAGVAMDGAPLRIAVLGTTYKRGSAMQNLTDHFLVGYPYAGEWHMPNAQVVSVYIDERVRRVAAGPSDFDRSEMIGGRVAGSFYGATGAGANMPATAQRGANGQRNAAARAAGMQQGPQDPADLGTPRAEQFKFGIYKNIQDALRCGTNKIAVDAVICIPEQTDYPVSENGQVILPNYDFFQQCALVFEEEKRSVPFFNFGPLSHSTELAMMMVKTADRLKIPLLAGSPLPVTYRLPEVDVPLGATVHDAVMVAANAWGGTDFDALEAMQAMLERRKGGETGIRSVQLLEGDDVFAAIASGRVPKDLLSSALSRSDTPLGLTLLDGRTQDLSMPGVLQQLVPDPRAYFVEYTDGTKGVTLMLNGAIKDFNIAVRTGTGIVSTQYYRPLPPNDGESSCLAAKVEELFETKSAPYSAKRTLLTGGILEAAANSRRRLNASVATPHLAVSYAAPKEPQYNRS